ncbi:MAG: RagB/SusD family nutrient uptake outer membrane protein [Prevotella sp.]|nr:RagB/SusD family nutrient uptake outer membrane protein [Prevotella sp.]
MKKINILPLLLCFSACLTGCKDYLDSEYLWKERMTTEDVFSNKDYVNRFLAQAYQYYGNNFVQEISSKNYNPFNFADDMAYSDRTGETNDYGQWRNGIYTEYGCKDNSARTWEACYRGIRQASIFLQHIDECKVYTQEEIADFKGQAKFLIAYFYWYMLRMYGPIPIIPDNGIMDYTKEYEDLALPRSTYDECVAYIENKLIEAAKTLPLTRPAEEIARPTRGAALGLRAKLLLYAASPLMNGKAPKEYSSEMVDNTGKHLLPDNYDEKKWAKAAAAARDVMEMNRYSLYVAYTRTKSSDEYAYPITITPPYDAEFSDKDWPNGWKNIDPFESYRSIFDGEVPGNENPEIIFTHGQNQGGEDITVMVMHQLPLVEAHGYNSHCMTLKQMDAYYMADGTDAPGKDSEIGRGNGTQRVTGYMNDDVRDNYKYCDIPDGVSLQFANREPRFYASVAYNGCIWNLLNFDKNSDERKDVQVWYYRGTNDGYRAGGGYPKTGIGIKKYVHPDDIADTDEGSYQHPRIRKRVDPDLRYADILLIYAEALNELTSSYEIQSWDGSKTYAISRDVNEMKKGIRPVRIRAGLPDYTADIYANQEAFRTKLKRERQIEFFAETQRYFDLRRWMDAPTEETIPVWGYNMLATNKMQDVFHTPIMIQDFPCTFTKKMWFWPIAQSELKRNAKLTQNPGWTYPE